MKKSLKGYLAFLGVGYRLIVLVLLPLVLLIAHIVSALHGWLNGNEMLLLFWVWSFVDIMADNWFLGGVQSKEREQLNYLKTSDRGRRLFRQILVGDVVRRGCFMFLMALVFLILPVCMKITTMAEMVGDNLLYVITGVIWCFAMTELGVFIARFWSYVWLNYLTAYLTLLAGTAIWYAVVFTGKLSWFIALFVVAAVLFSALTIIVGGKKMEESYYDK